MTDWEQPVRNSLGVSQVKGLKIKRLTQGFSLIVIATLLSGVISPVANADDPTVISTTSAACLNDGATVGSGTFTVSTLSDATVAYSHNATGSTASEIAMVN